MKKRWDDSAIVFAAPWLAGFVVLYLLPLAASAALSMTRWDGLAPTGIRWVGTENYRRLWADDRQFLPALVNSVTYTVLSVPTQVAFGLFLALLVQRARARQVWTTLYYLPHVLGGVATILIWAWLLNPQVGPINRGIASAWRALSLPGPAPVPPWLYSPDTAKASLVLMNAWHAGGAMLVCLAALLRVPDVYYEAARLDGAGPWRQFWYVTLPLVSPALAFNTVTGIIAAMQAFNQAYLLGNPQQRDALLFYMIHVYRTAFERGEMGTANAQGWVLFAVLGVFTALVLFCMRRWVHYDLGEDQA